MLFCEKCGTQIDEGSAFCSNCGTAVDSVSEEPVAPQPEEVAAVEENIPMDNFTADDNAVDTTEKKKRRLPIWAKIGIPVVALGLVVVLVLNISTIWGTLLKWFGSDEAYFRYVQSNAIEEMSENFVENYYSAKDSKEFKATVDMGVTVDESISDLIPEGSKEILDLINDLEFTTTLNSKGDKIDADLALGLNNKNVLSLETIVDSGSNSVYLTVPEILDKYLMTKLDIEDEAISFDIMNQVFEAMPENDDMKNLINDYSNIIFDRVDEVDMDSKTLKIEGIEQDCTTLSFEITEELAVEMVKAVLEKAKDDKTVEEMVKNLQKTVGIEDAYDDFSDAIYEALEELEDYDPEDVTYAEITEYVNSAHEIIGFEIEIDGQSASYATIADGTDIATEINFADQLLLVGKGSIKDGLLNHKLALEMSGKKLAQIKISNCDTNLAKKGLFAGNIKISLSEDGINLLSEESIEFASTMKLLNPSIEIDVKRPNENKCDIKFNILTTGDTVLLGFDASVQISSKADSIVVPNDAVDIEDDDAMQELVTSLDLNKILENLKDAGVPDEIFEMFSLFIAPTTGEMPTTENFDDGSMYDGFENSDDYDDYNDLSYIDDINAW